MHDFHLVDESPWPLLRRVSSLYLTLGLVQWFHGKGGTRLLGAFFIVLLVMAQWWRDVIREASFQGLHSHTVERGLRWGMGLFIVSEVIFFASFFWAFYHRGINPTVELGLEWPPLGVEAFNPWQVPLLNTLVLLMRGVTVTAAHHYIIKGVHRKLRWNLGVTVCLGGYFMCLQGFEYYEAAFRIADRVYGSTFFLMTGFHGLHVIVGALFLGVCFKRTTSGGFRRAHHFGFEAAA